MSVRAVCAHSTGVIAMARQLKRLFPGTPLIAGNCATYEGALELCELGEEV